MFDTALLESRKDRRGRGKGAGLPLAIGLHVAVIGAFVGASVWSVGEPPEPVIPVTFFAPPAAPPAPRGDGGHVRETTHVRHDPPSPSPVIALPDDPQPAAANAEPEGPDYPGPETGSTPGDRNGGDDGTGSAPSAGTGTESLEGPHVVGGDVRAPVLISQLEPDYPEGARRAHKDGVVILEAVITAGGAVEDVRILRSANPLDSVRLSSPFPPISRAPSR